MAMQILGESVKIKNHLKVTRKLTLLYNLITTNKVFLWQCQVMQVIPDTDWYIKERY